MKQLTRDEALMWLNDRVGQSVRISLFVDRGDASVFLIELGGRLTHAGPGLTPEHGEELAGVYTVGDDGGLNLSELPDDAFSLWQGPRVEELRIEVGEHAWIGIT